MEPIPEDLLTRLQEPDERLSLTLANDVGPEIQRDQLCRLRTQGLASFELAWCR
jgi:hypothetical protein